MSFSWIFNPLTFANGGNPTYPGVSFTSVTAGITQIRDTLQSAGWVTTTGSPSSLPLVMRTPNAIGGINAFIRITSSGSTNITIRGDIDGTGTNLTSITADTSGVFTIVDGADNRIWITCDEHSGMIIIRPSTGGLGVALTFGRVYAFSETTGEAIMHCGWSGTNTFGANQQKVFYIDDDDVFWTPNGSSTSFFDFSNPISNATTNWAISIDAGRPVFGYPRLVGGSSDFCSRGIPRFVLTGAGGSSNYVNVFARNMMTGKIEVYKTHSIFAMLIDVFDP